jgi:LPXTG-site transpeptidase (sortase) family protein
MVTYQKTLSLLLFTVSLLFGLMKLTYADEALLTNLVPTRIVISSINLDSPIIPTGYEIIQINEQYYTKWLVDYNLVGWQNMSAPIGQIGNTIFNGHSDMGGMVFQNLPNVKIGDEMTIFVGEQSYKYVISNTIIVQEVGVSMEQRIANAQWMAPTDHEQLTLITCLNPGATHRFIVIATPVYYAEVK